MLSNPNKIVKSVAFNKTNPDDARILKAISRRNFSGFVKKLILEYLNEKEKHKTFDQQKTQTIEEQIEEIQTPQTAAERLEKMKTQIKKTDIPAGPKLFKPQ